MDKLKELIEQRAREIKAARDLIDLADKEKRDFTDEENATYEKHMEESNSLEARIGRERKQRELDREEEERRAAAEKDNPTGGDNPEDRTSGKPEERDAKIMGEFRTFIRTGQVGAELRAASAEIDTEGGFLVPKLFINDLIKFVDDAVHIRGKARTFPVVSADSLGVPSLDTDAADADWTSEIATGSEDSSLKFGGRELHPHPLAKRIKISNKLLRTSAIPIEGLVRDRLGYKFGVTQEKGFLTGSGALQPLGVFTASADGISTGRDVSTGNTTSSPTFDGLIEAKYTLKPQYWNQAEWMFHRDAVKLLAKLKDGEGQYIWRQSVRDGEADRLLGHPFVMSEFAPNTFTTGLYVGIFCDWSWYWIADALSMQLQRLVELYAETNQLGLIGRMEVDGMPVLEEAFVRVKLG